MKKVRFSSFNMPTENGAKVYAIWTHENEYHDMVGCLSKNRRGKWQIDIPSLRKIKEVEKFEDAKSITRELLA